MASRTYDKVLECGCMISADGGGGVIGCYAEYGDMKKKKSREALELHDLCWDVWFKSKEHKEYMKEVRRRNG